MQNVEMTKVRGKYANGRKLNITGKGEKFILLGKINSALSILFLDLQICYHKVTSDILKE